MEIKGLDFSQFHPLDHRPGSARCRAHYGGIHRHAQLWWWYKFEYKPADLYHRVLCWRGLHHVRGGEKLVIMGRETTIQRCCTWCHTDESELK